MTAMNLVYGSYFLIFILSYALIALMLYISRISKIKILNFVIDPKGISRNRKLVNNDIKIAIREKRLALVWPIFLIERFLTYVKEKFKKEKQ